MSGKDLVLKEFRKITDLADICYVRQKDIKGLGDAVLQAERHIGNEPFAVLLGDSITKSQVSCTRQLMDVFDKYQKSTIALKEVPDKKVQKYGIVKADPIQQNIYKINHLIEKPNPENAPSNMAITGRYILTPDIFDKIRQTEVGIGDELHLTDALSKLDEVYGVAFNGKSYSLDDRLEWLKTSIDFALDDGEFRDDLVDCMKTFVG